MTRDIHTLSVTAVAESARKGLESAHRAAADFHAAMADAIEAGKDIEDTLRSMKHDLTPEDGCYESILKDYRAAYQDALGRSAVAFQAMPVKWAAVLSIAVDNVVQFKAVP